MKRPLVVALTLAAFAVPLLAQAPDRWTYVLDLTLPGTIRSTPEVMGFGLKGLVTGRKDPVLPLELRLVRMDRGDYVLGTALIYEISVRNVGQAPIDFPWSLDLVALEVAPRRVEAFIDLHPIAGSKWERRSFGSIQLQGSPEVPGSIQILQPGETALIRIPGVVLLQDGAEGAVGAGAVPVRAGLTLMVDQSLAGQRLFSVNAIPIALRYRVP
jgi:hypothetical protein